MAEGRSAVTLAGWHPLPGRPPTTTRCGAKPTVVRLTQRSLSVTGRGRRGYGTAEYPDGVSLDPAAIAHDVVALVETGPGCSVKDRFAALDLRSAGFTVLFDAEWIHQWPGSSRTGPVLPWRCVSAPADLARFAAAHGKPEAFVDAGFRTSAGFGSGSRS